LFPTEIKLICIRGEYTQHPIDAMEIFYKPLIIYALSLDALNSDDDNIEVALTKQQIAA